VKRAHIVHVTHRDQVEAPLTDWLEEAYKVSDRLSTPARKTTAKKASAGNAARGKPRARPAVGKKVL
jgi:hypothetical protein